MPIYHLEPGLVASENVRRRSYQSFACELLHFGPIALYCSRNVLDEDVQKLQAEGFDVRRMHAGRWGLVVTEHDDLQATLGLPDYYGKNLDALRDCLCGDLGIADDGGMAIVLDDFDDYTRRRPDVAQGMLDVFASSSRLLQVFAQTLLVLVHTKDPEIDFGPLGAVSAWWNSKEFVRASRGRV